MTLPARPDANAVAALVAQLAATETRLSNIQTHEELVSILHKARRVEDLARVAGFADLVRRAARTKLLAAWHLGAMLRARPKHKGGRGKTGPIDGTGFMDEATTLAAMGLTKNQSSRLQRIAARPLPALISTLDEFQSKDEDLPSIPALADICAGRRVPFGSAKTGGSDLWKTPRHILTRVAACFGGRIDLDPCADDARSVPARRHYTAADDGLSKPWRGRVFVNPPYSQVDKWAAKALLEHMEGRTAAVIVLVGARVDTAWFHEHLAGSALCFIRSRLKFSDGDTGASFPSMLVWLSEQPPDIFAATFADIGATYTRLGL